MLKKRRVIGSFVFDELMDDTISRRDRMSDIDVFLGLKIELFICSVLNIPEKDRTFTYEIIDIFDHVGRGAKIGLKEWGIIMEYNGKKIYDIRDINEAFNVKKDMMKELREKKGEK